MGKFAAVPETWTITEIEIYQKNAGVDGYVRGLSEDLLLKHGNVELPFVWEEEEPEKEVVKPITERIMEAGDLEEIRILLVEALHMLGL